MKAKIGLIGYGRIGKEVKKRVEQRGWVVLVIARTSGIYNPEGEKIDELRNWLEHFKKVDVAAEKQNWLFCCSGWWYQDVIGGFKFKINGRYVSGGFKNRTHNPLFLQLVPPGVNNAALIYGLDGVYILTCPGAGATPTILESLRGNSLFFLGWN